MLSLASSLGESSSAEARLIAPGRAPSALIPQVTPERLRAADEVLAGRLCLIGETYALPARPDWAHSPSRDKEWQIAQHKHPFAVDLAVAFRHTGRAEYLRRWVELTESWLQTMGTGFISASDAQVEAKRVEHWCLALLALGGTRAADLLPRGFVPALLERIGAEVQYILSNLKPARNHRTFQLYSAFMASALFPELTSAETLCAVSAALLADNLMTDIQADGVQVELSTHYHQLVMETAVAFVAIARWRGIYVSSALMGRIASGLAFSLWVQWPDGSLPLLGDSDDGDHRPLLALGAELTGDSALTWGATLGAAGRPPQGRAWHFADAGYMVLCDGWGDGPASYAARQHVTYDCGPLGAGSHCHYDLFSFTYFAGGEPLVIDPGRFTYDSAPDADGVDWRHVFKSTAAHNTVVIDGRDQTRYISKWRRDREGGPKGGAKHGAAPEIVAPRWRHGQAVDWVDATARSAEYAPTHRRIMLYMQRQYLLFIDIIDMSDGAAHRCDLRFHLAPERSGQVALARDGDALVARAPTFAIWVTGGPDMAGFIEESWASRRYGLRERAPALSFTQHNERAVAFCSAVAPDATARIWRMAQRGGPEFGQIRCVVEGSTGAVAWRDEVLVATGATPAALDEPDLRFRGRHLALRRDAEGRLITLCAHGADLLTSADLGELHSQEDLEWDRYAPRSAPSR